MTKNANIEFSDEEYARLQTIKGGRSWKEMLMSLVPPDVPDLPYRYWVSLGNWNPNYIDKDEEAPGQSKVLVERTGDRIIAFAQERRSDEARLTTDNVGTIEYVTPHLKEAKDVAAAVKGIIKEIWGYDDTYLDVAKISTQPICPKCLEQTRFRDEFCPKCGTSLVLSQDIPFE